MPPVHGEDGIGGRGTGVVFDREGKPPFTRRLHTGRQSAPVIADEEKQQGVLPT